MDGGDICADGTASLRIRHRGRHAKHVARFIHALKNRGGFANQPCHFVHDGSLDRRIRVLTQPLATDQHLGQSNRDRETGQLIDSRPVHDFFREVCATGFVEHVTRNIKIAIDLLLDSLILGLDEVINTECDMIQVGVNQSIHLVLGQPVVAPALPYGQRHKSDRGDHHTTPSKQGHLGV